MRHIKDWVGGLLSKNGPPETKFSNREWIMTDLLMVGDQDETFCIARDENEEILAVCFYERRDVIRIDCYDLIYSGTVFRSGDVAYTDIYHMYDREEKITRKSVNVCASVLAGSTLTINQIVNLF